MRRVFITENKVNGLTFPPVLDALVVFGLGYGVESLAGVPWLHDVQLFYWGDIDAHGFRILAAFRTAFPSVRSMLMDGTTLATNRNLLVNDVCAPVAADPPLGLLAMVMPYVRFHHFPGNTEQLKRHPVTVYNRATAFLKRVRRAGAAAGALLTGGISSSSSSRRSAGSGCVAYQPPEERF